jgi:hypothetical protein
MSTRAQIRIIEDGKHFDLYHHYDGYFECVGQELRAALARSENAWDLLTCLTVDCGGYESTSALHGDIEYYYEIDFDEHRAEGMACAWPPWPDEAEFSELKLKPNARQCEGARMDLYTGEMK